MRLPTETEPKRGELEMALLIQYTLVYASVLLLVALGGMYSERSGVINIGLEGIMIFGALGGAMALYNMPETANSFVMVLVAFLASICTGVIASLLLAVASITFKADQTLAGTAINMLGSAAATVITKSYTLKVEGKAATKINYVFQREALIFRIGKMEISWFVIVTLVLFAVATVVLYRTRFGLRLRACGEHPQAAASLGVDVIKMRYAGVLISGLFGGVGGITYITAANSSWYFDSGVMGMGFLALAVMIFGQWKPIRIALATLLFGVFQALASVYMGFSFLQKIPISGDIYKMLPYIVSLIVLALTSKKSRAPKAEGIPYDKGMR